MRRIVHELTERLSLRRCDGCDDPSPHSHHLTRLGHWRYIGRFR